MISDLLTFPRASRVEVETDCRGTSQGGPAPLHLTRAFPGAARMGKQND
jgi:hypothetical protein